MDESATDRSEDARLWDLLAQWEAHYRQGREITAEDLCRECPDLLAEVRRSVRALKGTEWLLRPVGDDEGAGTAESTAAAGDPAPGTGGVRIGEYTLLERIGAGGMGQVFRAVHRRMDRTVAVKLLPRAAVASPEAVGRFRREVRAAAKLTHPNIVTAYDAGEHEGTPYLVMEYVEGYDLLHHVERHGPLPVDQAASYIAAVAGALEYVHGRGVVHRDVKPANLLVAADGTVKLLDLGLARLERPADGGSDTPEAAVGTADFFAPEQAALTGHADHRGDIYSLGCTLYFLLTGRPVYPGTTVIRKLLAHQEAPIPSLRAARPDVPEGLDAVFRKTVAKRPEDRHQSMAEVAQALRDCLRSDREERATGPARGRRLVTAACVVLVCVAAASMLWRSAKDSEDAETIRQIEAALEEGRNKAARDLEAAKANFRELEELHRGLLPAEPPESERKQITPAQPPAPDTGTERAAAEWVLRSGGWVEVRVKGEGALRKVKAPADLPDGPFEVRKILLVGNPVPDEGLGKLAGLRNLKALDLSGTGVTDRGLKHLRDLHTLEGLWLGVNPVTGAGLEHLRGLTGLRSLGLNFTRVTGADLRKVEHLTGLTLLDLSGMQLGDVGLTSLGKWPLADLCLNGTDVTDKAVPWLVEMKDLRDLYLGKTRFTPAGVERIGEALPTCRIHLPEGLRK